ncbi:MAG: glycoside hydrolase family 27 protein [Planctomycetota bacterium]
MPPTAKRQRLAQPPMGWNSFDAYGCSADDRVVRENLDAFARLLRPAGYEYFVIDNGWFGEYRIVEGERFTRELHANDIRIDDYGRLLPSHVSFPDGFSPLIQQASTLGIKLGLHLMRGIPRKAVELNLPIEGTDAHAADIADLADTCPWCDYMFGVNTDHPAAQAYYDSVFRLFASWGIDFVKVDDIIHKPREIEAVAGAIEHCGRDLVLSLSPGGQMDPQLLPVYQRADMFRITKDIWDRRADLDRGFERWEAVQDLPLDGLWPDLDMIPFGKLMKWNPPGEDRENCDLLAGVGFERDDRFTPAQRRTFLAQRALAASPLFVGGDLVDMTDEIAALLTNPCMLACNQNGVVGGLQLRQPPIDVWLCPHRSSPDEWWLGIFNRSEKAWQGEFTWPQLTGFPSPAAVRDVWSGQTLEVASDLPAQLGADDVLFLHCHAGP